MKLIIKGLHRTAEGGPTDDTEVEVDYSPHGAVHPFVRLAMFARSATRRDLRMTEEEATAIGNALLIAARRIAE
jgi:hypothetical protein